MLNVYNKCTWPAAAKSKLKAMHAKVLAGPVNGISGSKKAVGLSVTIIYVCINMYAIYPPYIRID